jgi:hypothetical protein
MAPLGIVDRETVEIASMLKCKDLHEKAPISLM